ncbi:MAG: hypothetical protein CO096_02060 [Armatimonadetes bacterium CG_4_9_14_3_um_filter_66_14]|nr:MAG: hypothetical protein CO096_02060 [Armatimonadetes bacterium CG_4_9_14_3_um_filter_66_14]
MPKVLWLSSSPKGDTGYGRAARELLRRLDDGGRYEIHCLSCGPALPPEAWRSRPPMRFSLREEASWEGARNVFAEVCAEVGPHAIASFSDVWVVDWLRDPGLRADRPWIGYYTIDGEPLPRPWQDIL